MDIRFNKIIALGLVASGLFGSLAAGVLHEAALQGRYGYMLESIRSYDVNERDGKGRTPLHAAFSGRGALKCASEEVVRILLKNGADPNIRDASGATPLHLAARVGPCESGDCLRLLLEGSFEWRFRTAKPNVQDNDGYTPLYMAAAEENLRSGLIRVSPIYPLSESKRALAIKLLIANGAKTDIRGGELQNTPLHAAAFSGFSRVVDELMRGGADPVAQNKLGLTPLALARSEMERKIQRVSEIGAESGRCIAQIRDGYAETLRLLQVAGERR